MPDQNLAVQALVLNDSSGLGARLRKAVALSILAQVFLLVVFPLGLFLAFTTPAGLVGDEPAQMVRAQGLLNGNLIGVRKTVTVDGRGVVSAGMSVDPALVEASFPPGHAITLQELAAKSTMGWAGQRVFMELDPIAVNFPILYMPSAIGIGAAHLLGCRPFQAIYAGRLVSYLTYCLLSLLALLLARRAQALIFITVAMPMGLSIGASCSPDGLFIATAALAVALISRRFWRAAAFSIAIVILVKPPYGLLAVPLLLPLSALRGFLAAPRQLLIRFGLAALAILPGAIWFAYAMAFVSAPESKPPYHPGPLWPGDPNVIFYGTDPVAQLHVVLAHAFTFVKMVFEQFEGPVYGRYMLDATIGILNWLTMMLPPDIYKLWIAGAVGAIIADSLVTEVPGPSWRDSVILILVCLATVILVWLSEYLTWTNVGNTWIDGAQGRYLLPLIPMLGLALLRLTFPGAQRIKALALCLPTLAAFGTLILLPRWVAIQFYLS